MSNPTGWFAEFDEDGPADAKWRPTLQLAGGVGADFEMWLRTEEDCLRFIREEVIGAGMFPESPGGR